MSGVSVLCVKTFKVWESKRESVFVREGAVVGGGVVVCVSRGREEVEGTTICGTHRRHTCGVRERERERKKE